MEAAALYFRKSKLTVERCNGLRCSLTKNALPVDFILARSFSHALTALSSSPRSGPAFFIGLLTSNMRDLAVVRQEGLFRPMCPDLFDKFRSHHLGSLD